jgi:hypothetical protein
MISSELSAAALIDAMPIWTWFRAASFPQLGLFSTSRRFGASFFEMASLAPVSGPGEDPILDEGDREQGIEGLGLEGITQARSAHMLLWHLPADAECSFFVLFQTRTRSLKRFLTCTPTIKSMVLRVALSLSHPHCSCRLTPQTARIFIYCNSNPNVEQLAERMRAAEFTVASTHGGNSRQEQQACIAQFRSGAARLLIANDGLVRREMDAWWRNYVPLYINYDFPFNLNVFMLRLGQSGHFGRRSSAINFIKNDEEMLMLRDIQREFQISEIQPLPLNFYDHIM